MTRQRAKFDFRLFDRGSWPEVSRIGDILRAETVGGILLLVAAVVGLSWANSAWAEQYFALGAAHLGPSTLHLDLTITEWAADGLLAVFFFVVGLELKREFIAGDLRQLRHAALPVTAAIGGMAVPALIYTLVNLGGEGGTLEGWAIPTATDIAFALAVLAVVSTHLPAALRMFLLALAVVDDLIAIVIIAVFYTETLDPVPLLLALVSLTVFAVLVQCQVQRWWLLLPLAFATWTLVHASGVHATVAGMLLALTVPALRRSGCSGPGLAERLEARIRPLSAGLAVPIFAFFAAGVALTGIGELGDVATDPIVLGIVFGLVLGKTIGVFVATFLVHRFTHASLAEGLSWWDVLGLGLLAGVGFTVSLLIGELALGADSQAEERAKVAVLVGSVIAALLAAVVLGARNQVYRRIGEREQGDQDVDDVPAVPGQQSHHVR